ncbi:MAG: tetratricopeptide repeat protein [Calditrichaeota bacterium]|nr:tetratricopeptide repeat protein [Calditrichota bacterium]MCB9368408.1 tetratricopeptide repeat protein [Calditrichota bacterium]
MIRFVVALLVSCFAAFANPAFDAGMQAYNQSQWQEAISQWNSITASGLTSPVLEYNLGNAYFRAGDIEHSILHYERALKLNPKDEDARKNLLLANRAIVDQIPQAPKLGIWQYLDKLRDAFPVRETGRLLILLNALLAVAVGVMLYSSGRLRDVATRFAILFGIGALFFFTLYSWRASADSRIAAIVMVEKCDIFSSPSDNSTQLFSLHSGTKVHVGEILSEWTEIQLADGRKGWIPNDDIEHI